MYCDPYAYYGWDEMSSEDVQQNIFPYTFFYRENVDKYDDPLFCWEAFLQDEAYEEFFTFTSLYSCYDLMCGVEFDFEGSEHDVLTYMKAAQNEYNIFIAETFFDTSKLPKPGFHLSKFLY